MGRLGYAGGSRRRIEQPLHRLSWWQPLPEAISAHGQQRVLPHVRFLLCGSYEPETVLFAELEFERIKAVPEELVAYRFLPGYAGDIQLGGQ